MGIRKFILLTLLFIGLMFLLDFVLANVLSDFTISHQSDKRLQRLLEKKENSEIVIFGSSRAARDIIAKNLSGELRTSSYNYGSTGSNIDYHETLLNYLVANENHKTKLILLPLDVFEEFFDGRAITYRLDKLYPWSIYSMANSTINDREPLTYLSLSKSYVYKKCNLPALYAERGKIAPTDTILDCGSMPLSYKSVTFDTMQYTPNGKYDVSKENPELIAKFLSFVNICKQYDMTLLLIYPPNYFPKVKIFQQRIDSLIKGKNWVYVYESNDEIFKNKELYYDKSHLDSKGAAIFTKNIADFIKIHNLLK